LISYRRWLRSSGSSVGARRSIGSMNDAVAFEAETLGNLRVARDTDEATWLASQADLNEAAGAAADGAFADASG
jgi:hypothetical protein